MARRSEAATSLPQGESKHPSESAPGALPVSYVANGDVISSVR